MTVVNSRNKVKLINFDWSYIFSSYPHAAIASEFKHIMLFATIVALTFEKGLTPEHIQKTGHITKKLKCK